MKQIAIVGMGCLFPGASSIPEYWSNILSKRDGITGLKETDGFWKLADHFDPAPGTPDKTYAARAGYVPEVLFDPLEFGIPPLHLEAISAVQLLSLLVARQALDDAGLVVGESRDRKNLARVGVILGVSNGGQSAFGLASRLDAPDWKSVLEKSGLPPEATDRILRRLKDLYPQWSEASFSGLLGNLVAGRIANRFDLGGTNYAVDAACASSLAAIKAAMYELSDGSCDAVLTGGATIENCLFSFVCFSEIQALSKSGVSAPYDIAADGLVLGDGIGMVVLKRLEDALRDQDTIYAVIQGIGSASDGRTNGLYSPTPEGQVNTILRAYEKLPFAPETVGLIEGHGTGTIVGDQAELNSLGAVFANAGPKRIVLGSVKSQIGHTRAAAGAASVIKTALALHHKILPPTPDVSAPHPDLNTPACPFSLNHRVRPWLSTGKIPRRAGINGFGFGGTNFHLVLEEASSDHHGPYRLLAAPQMVVLHAPHRAQLLEQCEALLEQGAPAPPPAEAIPPSHARLGFVVESERHLARFLERAILHLQERSEEAWSTDGIWYRSKALSDRAIVVFPELSECEPGTIFELAIYYPEFRRWIGEGDAFLIARGQPPMSELARRDWPSGDPELSAETARSVAMLFQAATYEVLCQCGLKPSAVVGIADGERAGLWATQNLPGPQLFQGESSAAPLEGTSIPYYSSSSGKRVESTGEVRSILSASEKRPVLFTPIVRALSPAPVVFFVVDSQLSVAQKILRTAAAGSLVISPLMAPGQDCSTQFHQAMVQMVVAGVALNTDDPYRLRQPLRTRSASSVAVTLDGGTYLSSEARLLRNEALTRQEPPVAPTHANGSGDLHEIHRQFQKNQEQYLQTLTQMFERYAGLIERAKTPEEQQSIHSALRENAALLESNQQSYFASYESFLGRLGAPVAAPKAIPIAALVPVLSPAPAAIALNRDPEVAVAGDRRGLILGIVSKRTGYPVEMLGLDMDLEAEMGIDSLSRIEIFSEIARHHPGIFVDLATLDKMRTLSDVLSLIERGVSAEAIGPLPAKELTLAPVPISASRSQEGPEINRFAMRLQSRPPPDRQSDWLPESKSWIVTDEGEGLGVAVARRLRAEGAVVSLLRFPADITYPNTPSEFPVIALESIEEASLRQELPLLPNSLGGFLYIHPSGKPVRTARSAFQEHDYKLIQAAYSLARHLSEPLRGQGGQGSAFFAVVTRLDGRLGLGTATAFPAIPGALHGLAKTLRYEWPSVTCKAIDIAPVLSPEIGSERVLQELANPKRHEVEIAWDEESRWSMTAEIDDGESLAPHLLASQSVFLVSGGARGIVADCIVAAAEAYGCKFILVGRTAEPPDNGSLIAAQEEVRTTLERIRKAGGQAIYFSADITRRKDLASKLRAANQWGPVTGIIHTAARIADKPIERKSEADFRAVFETKVKGLENLLSCTGPDSPRHLWLFSSISGLFGNVGQTDYSMGNEVLNKFAGAFLALGKDHTVTTINWGPWNGGLMSERLKSYWRQITGLVEPAQVIRTFVDELGKPNRSNPQILINGFGKVPRIPSGVKRRQTVIHRSIALSANPFLRAYPAKGKPILPDMGAVNWMVEACSDLAEGYHFHRMDRFCVYQPVKFAADVFHCRLECVSNSVGTRDEITFEVKMTAPDANGCYYAATLSFGLHPKEHRLQLRMPADNNFKPTGRAIYTRSRGLFQGPLFQGIERFVTFDRDRVQARCQLASIPIAAQGQFTAEAFNPFVADVILQPGFVWFRQFQMQNAALKSIELMEQFMVPQFCQPYVVYGFVTSRSKNTLGCEIVATDDSGNTVLKCSGVKFAALKS